MSDVSHMHIVIDIDIEAEMSSPQWRIRLDDSYETMRKHLKRKKKKTGDVKYGQSV